MSVKNKEGNAKLETSSKHKIFLCSRRSNYSEQFDKFHCIYLNFSVDQPWSDLWLDSSEMEIFHLPWNWTLCKQLYWQIILCQVKQTADKLYIFNLMPTLIFNKFSAEKVVLYTFWPTIIICKYELLVSCVSQRMAEGCTELITNKVLKI